VHAWHAQIDGHPRSNLERHLLYRDRMGQPQDAIFGTRPESAYRKILCAVDFSGSSRAAFDAAVGLALTHDAALELLYVYDLPRILPEAVAETTIELVAGAVQDRLGEWRRLATAAGVTSVETVSLPASTVWSAIVSMACEGGHDLLVVGTHGRTGLQKALHGSVAERVVQHAPCPVLVVHAEAG
jgi:nucleotide-binding universal stress UspA family protein